LTAAFIIVVLPSSMTTRPGKYHTIA
jgi:hypothetical protein